MEKFNKAVKTLNAYEIFVREFSKAKYITADFNDFSDSITFTAIVASEFVTAKNIIEFLDKISEYEPTVDYRQDEFVTVIKVII